RNFTQGPNPNSSAVTSGYGYATFLLGTPTAGTARRYAWTTLTSKNLGFFIQDDWKVTPRLTLNLGLRWEYEAAFTDRFDAISNFDPNLTYTISNVNLRGGNVFPGTGGLPRGYRDNWFKEFGPRFGFAYQLAKGTVIRGGYGVYFVPTTGNFVNYAQAGFSLNTLMVTSRDGGFTPADTLTNPFPDG